ncbi:MAG: Gfo/Idh/MocA family oxidoreductase [Bacteroidales bacterium]|nr:Gfo/Idh/MocA family oxidoreductase [Bacteroidales bacterium]
MDKKNTHAKITRRTFLKNSGAAMAGLTILPSYVVGGLGHTPPSDKLNIAGIGVGGRGGGVLEGLTNENIVAMCDVDWKYAQSTFKKFPNAKKYYDWRKMFDEMGDDIDAVVVGTPDHTHAIVSIHAMKRGKHVYCEKPLTHSVWESRQMTEIARQHNVVTQMGNQGNSGEGIRQICEWIWDGAIGEIREAHAWTNRPIWPQGLERPDKKMEIPDHLKWDLFIGPADYRPYNNVYHPWNWRGWWDFGTGALGDMACHIMDPIFKALNLQYPTSVEASSSPINTESPPQSEIVHYNFPARSNMPKVNMPEVKVTWYDGGLLPERPPELPEGEIMGRDHNGGCLFVGSKGKLMCGTYGRNPFLLPLSYDESYRRPAKKLRRVEAGHIKDWARACKESPGNRVMPSSNFDYAGPLTEMVLMGVVAGRLQDLKRELIWDGKNMEFKNIDPDDEIRVVTTDEFKVIDGHPHFDTQYQTINAYQAAKEYIKHSYREGWKL